MSYLGSHTDAKACISEIELSENTRSSAGSAILHGYDHPGGAAQSAKPAGETLMPGRLRAGIKKPRTRTDTLTRLYGATDREHKKGV
jgi:hypothetical protein